MKSGLRTDSYPVCRVFDLGYSSLLGARAKKGIKRPRSTRYRRNDTCLVCALSIKPGRPQRAAKLDGIYVRGATGLTPGGLIRIAQTLPERFHSRAADRASGLRIQGACGA